MFKKNALMAALFAFAIALLLPGAPPPASAGESPPLKGAFAQDFTLLNPPVPAPRDVFQRLDGGMVGLAEFKGRVVVLNFWATWCAPCVREMPSLDRLQAALGPEGLSVVAVSLDRGGRDKVGRFLMKLDLRHMGLYLDSKATMFRSFGVSGLPTTFLIDRRGRIVGGMSGPAEWNSPEAKELIRYYLDLPEHAANPAAAGG